MKVAELDDSAPLIPRDAEVCSVFIAGEIIAIQRDQIGTKVTVGDLLEERYEDYVTEPAGLKVGADVIVRVDRRIGEEEKEEFAEATLFYNRLFDKWPGGTD